MQNLKKSVNRPTNLSCFRNTFDVIISVLLFMILVSVNNFGNPKKKRKKARDSVDQCIFNIKF